MRCDDDIWLAATWEVNLHEHMQWIHFTKCIHALSEIWRYIVHIFFVGTLHKPFVCSVCTVSLCCASERVNECVCAVNVYFLLAILDNGLDSSLPHICLSLHHDSHCSPRLVQTWNYYYYILHHKLWYAFAELNKWVNSMALPSYRVYMHSRTIPRLSAVTQCLWVCVCKSLDGAKIAYMRKMYTNFFFSLPLLLVLVFRSYSAAASFSTFFFGLAHCFDDKFRCKMPMLWRLFIDDEFFFLFFLYFSSKIVFHFLSVCVSAREHTHTRFHFGEPPKRVYSRWICDDCW